MYLWICYFASVISQRHIKNTFVRSWKLLANFFAIIDCTHNIWNCYQYSASLWGKSDMCNEWGLVSLPPCQWSWSSQFTAKKRYVEKMSVKKSRLKFWAIYQFIINVPQQSDCGMWHGHKCMVFQCSKLFFSIVSGGFLWQDSQSQ